MLPDFMIIGAQKSASTYIQQCIAEHPEVYLKKGETALFEEKYNFNKKFEDFKNTFAKGINKKAYGIKRPNYLAIDNVPGRIANHIPGIKLIVVLRNPVDRALSAYYHYMRYGFIPVFPIHEGLPKLIRGEYKQKYPRSKEIINFGFYYNHISRYLQYFNDNQLLIILNKDLKNHPIKYIQKTYQFIGVDDTYHPVALNKKRMLGVYSLPRIKYRSFLNSLLGNYDENLTRYYPKNGLMPNLIRKISEGIDTRILSKVMKSKKPKIDKKLKKEIYEIYKEDIAKLEGLIERDLSHWKEE